MRVLTDEELDQIDQRPEPPTDEESAWMLLEIKRHRAMVARLKEWAAQLEDAKGVSSFVSRELLHRMGRVR